MLTPHRLKRVCHRAEHLRLLDTRAITAGRPSRKLNAVLTELAIRGPDLTRSQLEEAFLTLLDAHRLPHPLVNTRVDGHTVDFFWPDRGLVVETDGAETHLTPTAFQDDRRRDVALTLAGYRVARFTWHVVTNRPGATGWAIRALLRPVR